MLVDDLFENVAGPEKCWPGHRKVGTKPGTGKNAGKRVNDCEKIKESTGDFNIGDPVIITGNVEYQGKTGDVREIGRDGAFVVVDLYNYGPYSFHSSDVSYNDYADSDEEEVTERAMIVPDNNAASAKKLYQYVARNLQDLASNTSFEVERFNRPYHEDKFNGFFKDSNGNSVKVLFDLGNKIEFENGALYIPVGMYYRYGGLLNGSTFVSNVLNALENQGIAEGDKIGNMDADRFDGAMARLKQLAGAGPLKTVWDPQKRVYKNVPTAVQPKK
jgi:hypothetical protein